MPAHLEMDFGLIRLGQVLGCPAGDVLGQPVHLVGAAMVWLAVERKQKEADAKRLRRRSRTGKE